MRARDFIHNDHNKILATLRTSGLIVDISIHVKNRQKRDRVPNRMLDMALFKLKFIKSEMAEFEPGDAFWALDPTTGLSLGIRASMNQNQYLIATIHRHRTFDTGDRPVIEMPRGDAITHEDLQELSFLGSPCTQDCSGHRAGYQWYQQKQQDPQSWSPSFNRGAALARDGK